MLASRVSSSQHRNSPSVASGLARRCSSNTASWPRRTTERRALKASSRRSPLQRLVDVGHAHTEQRPHLTHAKTAIRRSQHTIMQVL
jgi:hypothetical protein